MSQPLLQIENVTKTFGGLTAVNAVTVDINAGEILGLIGPNGAGKTTLFNMISGAFPTTHGNIYFDGRKISGLAPHATCQLGITRTFQIAKPFAKLSVVDNVKVGVYLRTTSNKEAEANARNVVAFVGLSKWADQPAHTLTTAGRKRLELARALATQPRLLLLDEVMAGLTPTESVEIVQLIREIRDSGITILVIEHVMKAIMSLSDRIAVLHHGVLIAIDQPQEVTKDERVIEAYLGQEVHFADG